MSEAGLQEARQQPSSVAPPEPGLTRDMLVARAEAGLGERAAARSRLDWVARHRTALGSVPEKVRWDGSPAGPAPLAWSAALIVSTEAALRG